MFGTRGGQQEVCRCSDFVSAYTPASVDVRAIQQKKQERETLKNVLAAPSAERPWGQKEEDM